MNIQVIMIVLLSFALIALMFFASSLMDKQDERELKIKDLLE